MGVRSGQWGAVYGRSLTGEMAKQKENKLCLNGGRVKTSATPKLKLYRAPKLDVSYHT